MKYFSVVIITFLMISCSVFSQKEVIKHTVTKGETVQEISRKYKVTPYDIYQLNPDVQSGLNTGMILLISKNTSKISTIKVEEKVNSSKVITHEVKPKETLYGLEKQYGVTDADLKTANPFLVTDGLKIGQIITIPSSGVVNSSVKVPVTSNSKENYVYHDVKPKETKYSIAKQYKTTVQDIEKRNPEVINNLPIGFRLTIKGVPPAGMLTTNNVIEEGNVVTTEIEAEKSLVDYEVKPKETLYSLSRRFGLTQEELIKINPALNSGMQEGMIIKVPFLNSDVSQTVLQSQQESAEMVTLSKKEGMNDRKKIALLLPFNLSKLGSDATTRLSKDKFLNITLDFYSGALMAIDSAKVLGLPIDISIFDSQENKNGSNVSAIIQDNNLEEADAIIGPFYQTNAETAANYLRLYDVPVISPLSKDKANPIDNLYQSVPTNDMLKDVMFSYMHSKNGNIIAVVDRKKTSIIQYIKENQPGIPFASFNGSGSLDVASLKNLLSPSKMNYVVMETGNTFMVKTTINAMLSVMDSYKVQLVILEPNETLETDEISLDNLVKLKLTYPSVTRENTSAEALIFEKKYVNKNNTSPSIFATRGFDITFDTMMRLAQGEKYSEAANLFSTEQVDNKFQYFKKLDGGYGNKGVYILYYDTDLTIKEAN